MISIYCRKCGYRKERENLPAKCPYCDSKGTLIREPSAQDIINDVAEEEDF